MRETTLQVYQERMLRVLVFIQQNLDAELSLEELARVAHFSPYHFHRIFRGMLGESVKGHIRRLRLERAANRLKLSERPITTIALESGYETHEAFTRSFRAMWGLSPSQFRSRRAALSPVAVPTGVHFREDSRPCSFVPLEPGGDEMEVEITTLEPMRLAFMRHVGPYSECGETWNRFVPLLGTQGRLGPGATFVGICHDDPEVTPPDRVRYDACVTVDNDFEAQGEIGVQTTAGGEYAHITHLGPYEKLDETYAYLMGQWLPRSGRELQSAPCIHFYMNDPEGTDPEDLITDIYAPLEQR